MKGDIPNCSADVRKYCLWRVEGRRSDGTCSAQLRPRASWQRRNRRVIDAHLRMRRAVEMELEMRRPVAFGSIRRKARV